MAKMNSNQTREVLAADKHTQQYKGSVMVISQPLFNNLKSRYFIINNQTQDLRGEHGFNIKINILIFKFYFYPLRCLIL